MSWCGNLAHKPQTRSDWVWYNFFRALYSYYYTEDKFAARMYLHNAIGMADGTYNP